MSTPLITYPLRLAIEDLITNTGGVLDIANLELALIVGAFSPNTRTTLADCEAKEPDNTAFPGYARITPAAWSAQYRDGADNIFQDMGLAEWIVTGGDCPVQLSVTGVFWSDGTNAVIEMFDVPQVVSLEGDAVRYIGVFAYGQ